MNKRKFEKLLKNNVNIPNGFEQINQKINYSQYSSNQKPKNNFIKLLTNKKVMAIVSSILILGIAIPLLNPFNKLNNSISKEQHISNNNSANMMSSMLESSILASISSIQTNISAPNSGDTGYDLVIISVEGIIKYDEDDNKRFYTDREYDNRISDEKSGYYNLNNATIENYKLVNDELIYNRGSVMLGVDLPINTRCHCDLIVDIKGVTDDYQIRDVYSINYLIF